MQDFEKIYTEYLKEIYRFLLRLSGNPDVAEELTQDTFAIAFENLDRFRGTCKISVWLCQIAKHEYYAWYRKHRPFAEEKENVREPRARSPEEELIDRETQMRIHEILHALKEPYREVFTLRVLAELSYRDIGRIFGKSEAWARVTHYRAKQMIAQKLGGDEDEM